MPTVDYLPVAVSGGANVDSQADFDGSGYQLNGFAAGLAQSKQLNKVWRQASMMAAAIANLIANRLGINVLDDGNLTTLIANLTAALTPFPNTPTGPVILAGSGTAYTLPASPTDVVLIIRNGLIQIPGAGNDYTIAGTAVTLSVATVAGDVIAALF